MKRFWIALGIATMGLTGIAMSHAPLSAHPEIACSADSGKAFAPTLTPQQICGQFIRALGTKAGTVRAELRFAPTGLASAKAWQLRGGQWTALPLFEMAVMDRRFNASDIKRLAEDVLRGMTAGARNEKG